jgi:copper homeostasis protein CutC
MITKMINKFGKRFTIIAAGSITNENLVQVHDLIDANEYHGKKIVCSL